MNLKELAKSKGTNLKKVAEKCGIPPSTLYAISRGDTNFDNVGIGTAIKVANMLGMTVEELYTGESRKYDDVQMPPNVEELVRVCKRLSDKQVETLVSIARDLAIANKKNEEGNREDVARAGIALK